jgi:hypothetical protein
LISVINFRRYVPLLANDYRFRYYTVMHTDGFDADGPLWKRILLYILGLAGVLVFYLGLKVIFGLIAPDAEAVLPYVLRYIRYVLVGTWISAGAPWVFVKLKLAKRAL